MTYMKHPVASVTERQGRSPPVRDEIVCATRADMARNIDAWDALARGAVEPNPFFESWYLLPSLQSLDKRSSTSILCFRQDGVLSGLMPVVRRQRYQRWPIANVSNWLHPNMFFGMPLISPGAAADFWRALLDWADANPGMSLFLHLNEIALDGPAFAALESVLAADGRPWAVVERKERALLASGRDAEAYLRESLSARKRKDLDRRYRRLCGLGEVEFRWETGSEGLARWIEEFLSLEASGWKGKAGSALACDPATDAMFRQSLTGAGERDRLVRLSLRLNGAPIAMLSTFLTPPGAFGFKTAFDEAYAQFSPGILLEREFLGAMKRFQIDWCDSCAAADHDVMNRIWRERRTVGRVSIATGGHLRRAVFSQLVRKETAGMSAGARA